MEATKKVTTHLAFVNNDNHADFQTEMNKLLTRIVDENGKLISLHHSSATGSDNKVVYSLVFWYEKYSS